MEPIIKSMLDDDAYKFSMMAAYTQLYPRAQAKFSFINRGNTPFDSGFSKLLKEQIDYLSELRLTDEERSFLEKKCPYFSPVYLDLLSGFKYDPNEVHIYQNDSVLNITAEGYLYRSSMWEVKLMAIISELYFKTTAKPQMKEDYIYGPSEVADSAKRKAIDLIGWSAAFADFGTRRRYSYRFHDIVVASLKEAGKKYFVGTSNVHLAMKHDLSPIGTQAHEWYMFHAAKYGFTKANSVALGRWADVYNGNLGIALSDTFTTQNFFASFDTFHAKLWDGVRHDSGDPFSFGERVIKHYISLGIDPKTKTIVFSDGLDTGSAIELKNYFNGKIKTSFGIGTHFTNDVGAKPLNMVIKMTEAKPGKSDRWISTVKLSDNTNKNTGDSGSIKRCKEELGLI